MTTGVACPTPILQFFANDGSPLAGGSVLTQVGGVNAATYQDITLTTPLPNPIPLNSRGEVSTAAGASAQCFLTPNQVYTFTLSDASGNQVNEAIYVNGVQFELSGDIAASALNIITDTPILNSFAITAAETAAGVTPVNYSYDPNHGDIRRWTNSIVLDGSTDNTAAISAAWTILSNYRGIVAFPPNCKFTKSTVYSTAPVGVQLQDFSDINTGQPPSYQNKISRFYSNDTSLDDSSIEITSAYHPALRINNLATASGAISTIYRSILFASGFRWNNDPIDWIQYLTYLSPRGTSTVPLSRSAWVINTKAQAAMLSVQWLASTFFASGALINTSDGNVWINNGSGGTSGTTEPTGTGPTFPDGGITWTWLYAWDVGSTLFYFDEDGQGGLTGSTLGKFIVGTATLQGISIACDQGTGDVYIRDEHRSVDLLRLNTAKGLTCGALPSLDRGSTLSGATPAISNQFHAVTNSGATNMTGITLPSGQTNAWFTLYFTDGNTTLKATGFNLKGGTDVTPSAGSLMTFFLDPGLSAAPTEMYRNF